MFPGIGTIINVIAIVGGGSIGILLGNRMAIKTRVLITDILGLVVLLGAASALKPMWSYQYTSAFSKGAALLVVLGSLLVGGLIGSAVALEQKLDLLGENLRRRFKASKESRFVDGFVTAALLFAIGPLAILGSISDGMSTGIDQLLLKSALDFFAAMAFATSSARVIPAKMLMMIACRFLYSTILSNAFKRVASFAPPPISRKFAGFSPVS